MSSSSSSTTGALYAIVDILFQGEGGSLDSKTALPSRAEQVFNRAYQDTPNHTIAWQAQAELDDLIASECVFCGDLMIRLVDEDYQQNGNIIFILQKHRQAIHR